MPAEPWSVRAAADFEAALRDEYENRLLSEGLDYAESLLDEYERLLKKLTEFPEWCPPIDGVNARWTRLGRFVVVFSTDRERHVVHLLRLYYLSSDWRAKLLGE